MLIYFTITNTIYGIVVDLNYMESDNLKAELNALLNNFNACGLCRQTFKRNKNTMDQKLMSVLKYKPSVKIKFKR